MSTSEDSEFSRWCKEFEFTQHTIECLEAKGFNSFKTVATLDEKRIKALFEKQLVPAQLFMLMQGAAVLRQPEELPPTTRKENREGEATATGTTDETFTQLQEALANGQSVLATEVQRLLRTNDGLANNFGPGPSQTTAPPRETCIQDPYQFGRGQNAAKRRQVTDFVSGLAKVEADSASTLTLNGVEFSAAPSARKIPHSKLTVTQLMEGSLRILHEMMSEDGVGMAQVGDYINYLIQSPCLLSHFHGRVCWTMIRGTGLKKAAWSLGGAQAAHSS